VRRPSSTLRSAFSPRYKPTAALASLNRISAYRKPALRSSFMKLNRISGLPMTNAMMVAAST
jgi:hypothetical protein